MQAYAPRDPIREYVQGTISRRQLRVMIDHLPPGNPAARAVSGPWGPAEYLLWDVSSRLRDLLSGYYTVHGGRDAAPVHLGHLPTPDPTPYQQAAQAAADDELAVQRQSLAEVLARPGARVGGDEDGR